MTGVPGRRPAGALGPDRDEQLEDAEHEDRYNADRRCDREPGDPAHLDERDGDGEPKRAVRRWSGSSRAARSHWATSAIRMIT
jgi:hypothetical protein